MPGRIDTALNRLRQDLSPYLDETAVADALPGNSATAGAAMPPDPLHHHPLVPHPGPPRQYRPDPRHPQGPPRLHRVGLLPGPRPAPPGRLPRRAPLRDRAPWSPRTEAEGRWRGHRTFLIDGSSFSMPDTPELRRHFGQPGSQAPGCGFPVAKILALFHAGTGLLLDVVAAPLRTHEMGRVDGVHPTLQARRRPGRRPRLLLVRPPGACCSAAACTPCSASTRSRSSTSRPAGRTSAPAARGTPRDGRGRGGCGRSGVLDQVVEWFKPADRPAWMTAEQFAALPEAIVVRELRYAIGQARLPDAVGDAGDDAARRRGVPAGGAGGALRDAVAGGGISARFETNDEDGCVALQDGRWGAQGVDGLRDGLQPGAAGDGRGGAVGRGWRWTGSASSTRCGGCWRRSPGRRCRSWWSTRCDRAGSSRASGSGVRSSSR